MSIRRVFASPLLRRVVSQTTGPARCMSAAADRLLVDMDTKTGVATVKMNRPPVNSLNLEFLTDINILLEKLENDKSCRGLILTSSNNKIFCAGLDIMEMYNPQRDRLTEFWRMLQNVWINLYNSRLITIAAINGHSPAGGCLLATCCDYRVMVQNFTIGLNETQLGIIPPFWFVDSMEGVIGYRQTEKACQKGLMMTTEQAFEVGLVDEVVTPEIIIEKAQNEMKSWLKIPDFARQLTKTQMKKAKVDKLLARREEDIEHFVNFITKDSVQKALGFYLEQMKNKAAKK
ncbi:enoyl-CoA delta isomerase 1, mitochondrial-like [Mercenaria mercenaria]|uniref:enoyl-CoA delta isomerase 1, mitochondrial-like n=1 Tax=Mercenaria mercenaria TaxID=6596 RepID=UPI001E1DCB61|nr:enoyl-CoA delta isomerase 1, mitochondrial-like [Mercenaria mercenaria]XP_045214896.1 enoyl-CoA delta isomerase 1, mitochondrial-like [Mercenaria mercenaria]